MNSLPIALLFVTALVAGVLTLREAYGRYRAAVRALVVPTEPRIRVSSLRASIAIAGEAA